MSFLQLSIYKGIIIKNMPGTIHMTFLKKGKNIKTLKVSILFFLIFTFYSVAKISLCKNSIIKLKIKFNYGKK